MVILISASLTVLYIILYFLLGSFGIQFLNGDIFNIISNLQNHYTNTRLGIPLDQLFVFRLFNYLFYPLPWSYQTTEILIAIIMFENLIILFTFIYFIINWKNLLNQNYLYFFGLMSFIFLLLMLSLITSNYGIAFRQKWMIVPFILILFCSHFKKEN